MQVVSKATSPFTNAREGCTDCAWWANKSHLLTDNTMSCSSPTALLRDLQSVIVAEQTNVEVFISRGILSTMSKAIASSDSNVQMETIVLLWKVMSTPTFTEVVKVQSDLVPVIQRLQKSGCSPDVDLAITCVLWDMAGESNPGKLLL